MLYSLTLLAMTTRFRLAEVLKERNMSQSELSRLSGVSFPTVNAICNNKTGTVALGTLDKIATALGVAPGNLLDREATSKRKGR